MILPFSSLGQDTLASSRAQSKAIILKQRVPRFPIWSVLSVIGAGILIAALIVIVAGNIDHGPDPQRAAEPDGIAVTGVTIIPGRIQQEAEAADRDPF